MDRLFEMFEDLLRSLFGESRRPDHTASADPDLREAWDELEEYLRTGRNTARPAGRGSARPAGAGPSAARPSGAGPDGGARQRGQSQAGPTGGARQRPGDPLARDYANLQVPFGAPFEQVHQSYKRLLRQYHPDRFAADPEKQKTATRITQEITSSFQNIRRAVEKRKNR